MLFDEQTENFPLQPMTEHTVVPLKTLGTVVETLTVEPQSSLLCAVINQIGKELCHAPAWYTDTRIFALRALRTHHTGALRFRKWREERPERFSHFETDLYRCVLAVTPSVNHAVNMAISGSDLANLPKLFDTLCRKLRAENTIKPLEARPLYEALCFHFVLPLCHASSVVEESVHTAVSACLETLQVLKPRRKRKQSGTQFLQPLKRRKRDIAFDPRVEGEASPERFEEYIGKHDAARMLCGGVHALPRYERWQYVNSRANSVMCAAQSIVPESLQAQPEQLICTFCGVKYTASGRQRRLCGTCANMRATGLLF